MMAVFVDNFPGANTLLMLEISIEYIPSIAIHYAYAVLNHSIGQSKSCSSFPSDVLWDGLDAHGTAGGCAFLYRTEFICVEHNKRLWM